MTLFITFEGPEGSGKTTQIRLLENFLKAHEFAILVTREPGGTTIGNAIRAIVLDPNHTEMSPRAEVLLFNAARAQIVDEVIRPALTSGRIVLCDRYADSTLAYQGYGHGQDLAWLRRIIDFATNGLQPDLTIFLNIDPDKGLARKQSGAAEEWNRMEQKALTFHQTVRQGYLQLAAAEPPRWLVIDATQTVEAIYTTIRQRVELLLKPELGM
ncbi:dTMP kinase [soil metagenome]